MEFKFQNKDLNDLYHKGKSKKYKIQPTVLRKFFMAIQHVEAADTIYDLWKTVSLKYEKLQGFEKRYSIRLTDQWRLEIEVDWQDEGKTKGIFNIVKLSKHYED